jgi:hypothetical protein
MAGRTFNLPAGTMPPGFGQVYRTDAEYHTHVDDSKPIGTPPANLSRYGRPTLSAVISAETFGIKSRISGPTRGDAPAVAYNRVLGRR